MRDFFHLLLIVTSFVLSLYTLESLSLLDFIKTYQTLIAALIATLTAYATIQKIEKQIVFEKIKQKDSLDRKVEAFRATCLGSLGNMCDLTKEIFNSLYNNSQAIPFIPADHIKVFEQGLQYLERPTFNAVRALVNHRQIFNSRLKSYQNDKEMSWNKNDILGDLIYLRYLVDRFFKYARGEQDNVLDEKPTWEEFCNSFNCLKAPNINFEVGQLKEYYQNTFGKR